MQFLYLLEKEYDTLHFFFIVPTISGGYFPEIKIKYIVQYVWTFDLVHCNLHFMFL